MFSTGAVSSWAAPTALCRHPPQGPPVLKLGTGDVLTDPESDIRTWLDATLFADGELKIGFAKVDAAGREVLAAGKLCSNAKYNAIQTTPWASFGKSVKAVTIAADASRLANVNLNYWFYGCSALASVSGMANLRGVARMDHTFNSCSALAELDLRGMSPAALASMAYTFGACTSLAKILVDADWELLKGMHGLVHVLQPQGHRGRQRHGLRLQADDVRDVPNRPRGTGGILHCRVAAWVCIKWCLWRLRRCPSCAVARSGRAAPVMRVRRCDVAACSEDLPTPR